VCLNAARSAPPVDDDRDGPQLAAAIQEHRSRWDKGWHSDLSEERLELDEAVPQKLELVLNPMSNYIKKGHRIRIAINNFDKDAGLDTPTINPAPIVKLYRDLEHSSFVALPFVGVPAKSPP
jgi:hypothetical protein